MFVDLRLFCVIVLRQQILTTAHKDHNAMATNDDDDEDDKDDVRTGRMIYAFCYSCFGIHAIS